MLKPLLRRPWVISTLTVILAAYIRFVRATARLVREPDDLYAIVERNQPVIFAMWHGEHLTSPLMVLPQHRIKVLISRHRDGEINAQTIQRLGIGVIRGSGSHGTTIAQKRGAAAMRDMLSALQEGWNVASTADVPKIAKKAGRGLPLLAKLSGRPIYPVMPVASRRFTFKRAWDKAKLPLPFARVALVLGNPVHVPADADEDGLEAARLAIESELNRVMERAYGLAEGKRLEGVT